MPKVKLKIDHIQDSQKENIPLHHHHHNQPPSSNRLKRLQKLYKILDEVEDKLEEILETHAKIVQERHQIFHCLMNLQKKLKTQEAEQQTSLQELHQGN